MARSQSGERRKTITFDPEETASMLEAIIKQLKTWHPGRSVNRSRIIREAIRSHYHFVVNGILPKDAQVK